MPRMIRTRWVALLICTLLGALGPDLCAQAPAAQQNPPAPAPAPQAPVTEPTTRLKFVAIGFRVRSFPLRSFSVMANERLMSTTVVSKTAYDWTHKTTSSSPRYGFGPAIEARLGRHMTVSAAYLFHRLRYEKLTDVYSGTDDPATGGDERSHTNITENTKARLWELPVMLHYRGFRSSGLLSHLMVGGGVTGRMVSNIRTSTKTTSPDGSTSSSEARAHPSKRNLLGAVVSVGFRFVDELGIKVTPEIRYTRWGGSTFALESTRSPRDQFEIGIGFTR